MSEPLTREEREALLTKLGACALRASAAEERAERLREFVQRIARDKWTVWQRDAQELLAADDAARGGR